MSDLITIILMLFIFLFIYKQYLIKKEKYYVLIFSTFYLYLMFVLFLTIFPLNLTFDFKWEYHSSINFVYIHLIPFNDLILGHSGAVKEILLNILMTIPFGFIYPLLTQQKTLFQTFKMTFFFSLSIEFTQLLMTIFLLHYRSCDVTDLITNVTGGVSGFIIYKLFEPKIYESLNRFKKLTLVSSKN